jgi:hypothetical protein
MSKTMQYFWDEAEKNVDEIAMKVVKGLIDLKQAVKEVGDVANLELLGINDEMDAEEYLENAIEDLKNA